MLLSYNTICDIDIKTVKDVYHAQCAFRFSLNDYPNEFDFEIVNKNGWYKASNMGNNLCGVSRDHRFSVTDAFVNHIDPYLISHPANCCLMQHTENQSKGKNNL